MDPREFRVCRARYSRLDGEGARLAGGRWNSPGHAVVYMAETIALAVLENLVHMNRQDFPVGYVCIAAILPSGVSIESERDLRLRPGSLISRSQDLGDWWIRSGRSTVLEVPSTIVQREHNYLLNPAHPEFAEIITEPPALFHFDPRLFSDHP